MLNKIFIDSLRRIDYDKPYRIFVKLVGVYGIKAEEQRNEIM